MKFVLMILAFYPDGTKEPKLIVPMPSYEHCMGVKQYYDEIPKPEKVVTLATCFDPTVLEDEH